MAEKTKSALIDERLLKALAHPTRQLILDILSRGPSSPVKMSRELDGVSLNLVSHHIKVLRDLDCIELVETIPRRGATEHVYRTSKWVLLSAGEWEHLDASKRYPITANILRLISEDTTRSVREGSFEARPDNHLSRSPVRVDEEGWSEIVELLKGTLSDVLEIHARSAERSQRSGEKLMDARVVIMQYLLGRAPAE